LAVERRRPAHVQTPSGASPYSGAFTARMESNVMLGWALTFLVVALIAGVLGFTTIAGTAIGVAKILFYVFLVLFLVSLVMNFLRGRSV
jgi:uncharacterized membrane protein YtjA (UPF0391 family)